MFFKKKDPAQTRAATVMTSWFAWHSECLRLFRKYMRDQLVPICSLLHGFLEEFTARALRRRPVSNTHTSRCESNGGATEAEHKFKVEMVLDELVEEGFLEVVRVNERGRKVYRRKSGPTDH